MTRAAPAPQAAPTVTPAAVRESDRFVPYLEASTYPLTSLAFVFPLVVAYEAGTRWWASDPVSHVQQRIVAFNLMQSFFAWFGVTGLYFPAFTVASVLMAWHLARGDGWTAARPLVLLGMVAESAMYAVPLVGLGYAFQRYLPLLTHVSLYARPSGRTYALVVLSIGAGVYEELIFRLVAFTVLHFLLVDCLRVPKRLAIPLMVLTSAVAFSLYHYRPTGTEPFQWESFTFRTIAGVYFGLIFACRGFGLTAGAHSAYDVCIVLLKAYGPA